MLKLVQMISKPYTIIAVRLHINESKRDRKSKKVKRSECKGTGPSHPKSCVWTYNADAYFQLHTNIDGHQGPLALNFLT